MLTVDGLELNIKSRIWKNIKEYVSNLILAIKIVKHKSNDKLDYMETNNCSSKEMFKRTKQ